MTTIAYSHKARQIAVDGRSTQGDHISNNAAQKWLHIGDDVWFFTGSVADREIFLKYQSGELTGKPAYEVDCSAFLVSSGECFEAGVTPSGQAWRFRLSHDHTAGSGKYYAIAAMDHGKSPDDAVIYASTRDIYTGGKVSVFDLATMQFIGDK